MIFSTTLEAIRQGIRESELRMNLLRICARAPRTIHDLIHAPAYPGIEMSLFSLQSEINVTVELGECKNRGLLVRVGKVPDPIVPGGYTELVRTSLFAFLACPELAYAEPKAYGLYLTSWFALPEVREALGPQPDQLRALIWAFPELAHRSFYVAKAEGAPQVEMPKDDRRKIFGCYYVEDVPTRPEPISTRELLTALRRPPLSEGWRALRGEAHVRLDGARVLQRAILSFGLGRPRWVHRVDLNVRPALLSGPELHQGRLRPIPLG